MKRVFLLIMCLICSGLADISGTKIINITQTYTNGDDIELKFKLEYHAGEEYGEWVDGVTLDFPEGVIVNSATDIKDVYDLTISPDGTIGYGAKISWGSVEGHSGSGDIGGDAEFSVVVNITESFSGNMDIEWFVNGDGSNAEPHTQESTMTIIKQSDDPFLTTFTEDMNFEILLSGLYSTKTFKISNPGGSEAVINESDITFSGVNASEFKASANTFPITIPANGEYTFIVSFYPASEGEKSSDMKIGYNLEGESIEVALTGKAYLPYSSLSESFETDKRPVPEAWKALDFDGDGNSFVINGDDEISGEVYDGTRVVGNQYNLSADQVNNNDWLISPRIHITPENRVLTFFAKAMEFGENDYTEEFNVRIYESEGEIEIPDTLDFEMYERFSHNGREWKEYKVDLLEFTGKDIEIAWQHTSFNQNSLLIDKIELGEPVFPSISETFNSPAFPSLWTKGDWTISEEGMGRNGLRAVISGEGYLITPAFICSEGFAVNFWTKSEENSSIEVYVSETKDEADFIKIADAVSENKWVDNNFEITGQTGKRVYLIFKQTGEKSVMLDDIKINAGLTDVEEINIVENFSMISNYPNPFNPSTTINFSLAQNAKASVMIYNSAGQMINSISKDFRAGINSVKFDGSNNASGIYFYRVKTDRAVSPMKKMVLIK